MKKLHLFNKPARKTSDLMFDDMHYELVDDDITARAERIQAQHRQTLQLNTRASSYE